MMHHHASVLSFFDDLDGVKNEISARNSWTRRKRCSPPNNVSFWRKVVFFTPKSLFSHQNRRTSKKATEIYENQQAPTKINKNQRKSTKNNKNLKKKNKNHRTSTKINKNQRKSTKINKIPRKYREKTSKYREKTSKYRETRQNIEKYRRFSVIF